MLNKGRLREVHMEAGKLLKFAVEYVSNYLEVLFATVKNPTLAFRPIESVAKNHRILATACSPVLEKRFNPKLLSFLTISFFIGSVFNSNTPTKHPAALFAPRVILVIGYWLFFAFLAYLLCRIFWRLRARSFVY